MLDINVEIPIDWTYDRHGVVEVRARAQILSGREVKDIRLKNTHNRSVVIFATS